MHQNVNVHDKHGNVIGGFPFMALAPLIASAVGPLLNKVLGNGMAHSMSHPTLGHHQLRKTKETKRGNGLTDSESYLVPQVAVGQTPHLAGGAMGFGATGFGTKRKTTKKGGAYMKGYVEPGDFQYGGISYPRGGAMGFGAHSLAGGATSFGGSSGIPLNIGVKGSIGGTGKGRGRGKKGGYAVDQMHSHAYSGFSPGNHQVMFPVSQA